MKSIDKMIDQLAKDKGKLTIPEWMEALKEKGIEFKIEPRLENLLDEKMEKYNKLLVEGKINELEYRQKFFEALAVIKTLSMRRR